MNDTTNAAKRPSGLRACADGLDANPDKDFAQKCMRHAADRMEKLETELTAVTEQRDRLAEAMRKIQKVGLVAVDAFDELDRIDEIVDEALAAVKGGADE